MSGKPSESQPSSGRPHDGGDDGFLDALTNSPYRIEDDKVKPPEIPGVLLTIEYDSFAKKSNRPVTDALTELSAAHDLILAQFFGMVPKEAYEAFQ